MSELESALRFVAELAERIDGLDEMLDALAAGVRSLAVRIEALEHELEQSA
jgi:hypothetical protein